MLYAVSSEKRMLSKTTEGLGEVYTLWIIMSYQVFHFKISYSYKVLSHQQIWTLNQEGQYNFSNSARNRH